MHLLQDLVDVDGSLLIQNRSPVPVTLPEGIELAKADVDLSSYKVAGPEAQRNYTLEIAQIIRTEDY